MQGLKYMEIQGFFYHCRKHLIQKKFEKEMKPKDIGIKQTF